MGFTFMTPKVALGIDRNINFFENRLGAFIRTFQDADAHSCFVLDLSGAGKQSGASKKRNVAALYKIVSWL
jgi:hypothetical protein